MNTNFSVILIFGIFSFYFVLWVIYFRQYRFASYLFDLLPFYTWISLVSGIVASAVFWILFHESILKLFSIALVIALFAPQVVLFKKWQRFYKIGKYEKLLVELSLNNKIKLLSFEDYLDQKTPNTEKSIVIIRHDVDISLKRAEKMLQLDKKYEIPSTYFFRNKCEKYIFEDIIGILNDIKKHKQIQVGFHYSTLTNTKGNIEEAKSKFVEELSLFNRYVPIKFLAAHGDRFRNRQLITNKIINLEELNLYSAYEIHHDIYLSEAGGLHHFKRSEGKITFDKQIEILDNPPIGKVIQILIHPDWWF